MRRSHGYCGLAVVVAFGLFAGDVTEAERRIFEAQEAQLIRELESVSAARHVPGAEMADACNNGGFELGFKGWAGAYGNVAFHTDEPNLDNLKAGISEGPLDRRDSRQTLVSVDAGPDPITGISQVEPSGAARAVRIGNMFHGGGVELLERTFVVPSDRPVLGFRYAVVLEDPDHEEAHQPLFRVRVLDAQRIEIPGVVDLNTGGEARTDRLVADSDNPFFEVIPHPRVPIDYSPWTCASIELSGHVGRVVTVQFIVEDCSELGHWGYAYVDEFCDAGCAIVAPAPPCGSGPNLVSNGDFEAGNSGFDSAFVYVPAPIAAKAVLPGSYAIVDGTEAAVISRTWAATSPAMCDSTGKFLAVNGDTGIGGSRMIWSQTIPVEPGKAYRFCVWRRKLPQCALDVSPEIELRFSIPPDPMSPSTIEECDWKRDSRRIVIPAGVTSLTAEIWLDETARGDGNDIAIDDISLRVDTPELVP